MTNAILPVALSGVDRERIMMLNGDETDWAP